MSFIKSSFMKHAAHLNHIKHVCDPYIFEQGLCLT